MAGAVHGTYKAGDLDGLSSSLEGIHISGKPLRYGQRLQDRETIPVNGVVVLGDIKGDEIQRRRLERLRLTV
jgi:hypothetical protein